MAQPTEITVGLEPPATPGGCRVRPVRTLRARPVARFRGYARVRAPVRACIAGAVRAEPPPRVIRRRGPSIIRTPRTDSDGACFRRGIHDRVDEAAPGSSG